MSDNQKKLNEQLAKIVMDDNLTDEVKLKKVKYLIYLGANVNQKVNGKSLLKIAREKGYKEIENVIKESLMKSVDELLEGDKCENVLDELGYFMGGKDVVSKQKAIDLGKQFWDKNGNLKSAKEIEVLIQQGADVNVQNIFGATALIEATCNGLKEVAEVLLEGGADVNVKSKTGDTALIIASYCGHKEVAEVLLEGGADMNHKDKYGNTALLWAAYKGSKDIVQMLLEKRADVNIKDDDGYTALMWASKAGYKEIVQLLLENGADVNAQENNGWTALMCASYCERKDIVVMLLEKGADANIRNNRGSRVWESTNREIVNVIIEHIQKTGDEPTKGGFLGKIFGGLTR